MKRDFQATFYQLSKFPTNIDAQTLWDISFPVSLISKLASLNIDGDATNVVNCGSAAMHCSSGAPLTNMDQLKSQHW